MTGPQADEVDWESMTNKELHDKFQHMLGQQVEDVMASFGKALARIEDVEKTIDTMLDAKFDEVLARLPQPPPASAPPSQQQQQQPPPRRETTFRRAGRVPLELGQNSGAAATTVDASVAHATTAEVEDYYEDEVDQNQNYVQSPPPPPPGRPHVYHRNGRAAAPPQVRYDDHIPKLKLNIPPFDGRYIPDVFLTWELETEQRFTCLQYPEDRRVAAAAVCEFTCFASIWWCEHCRLCHDNIPTTWAALNIAMRTRWVPPYYQHELVQKLQRLTQGKNYVEEYY